MNYYLILVVTELAESHSWLIQAENIAVPVLYLIGQFSEKGGIETTQGICYIILLHLGTERLKIQEVTSKSQCKNIYKYVISYLE